MLAAALANVRDSLSNSWEQVLCWAAGLPNITSRADALLRLHAQHHRARTPARLQLLMPRPGRRWKHLKQKQRGQVAQPSRWYSSLLHHTQRGTRLMPASDRK